MAGARYNRGLAWLRVGSLSHLCVTVSALAFVSCATPADLPGPAELDRGVRKPVVTPQGNRVPESVADDVVARATGETTHPERAALEKLTDAVRKSLSAPLVTGNQVEALVDGPQTFAAINKAIAAARHHVHVETYIFADDELGRQFAALLTRKSQAGVQVRLIYDGVGSLATAKSFFDGMRDAGVEALEFHPLNPAKTLPWKFHNRDHRKIVIVDGRHAFTGGINISSTYSSSSGSSPGPERGVDDGWRDTHAHITGPVVAQFQTLFLDTWERLGGKIADKESYFPKIAPAGDALVSAVASTNGDQKEEEIYRTNLAAIRAASKRVWITQAYFSPPAELRDAMIDAARRGVDVRVIVPGFTDSKLIFYAARNEYHRLLEGKVRIIEREDALLHAKTALVDDSLVLIGSANLDYRSFLHNNEVTAVIFGERLVRRMAALFESDLKRGKELTLASWNERPVLDRVKERLSSLVKFWL